MLRNHAVAKSRDYRANSHAGEDKNMSYIKHLVRGGGSGIRTHDTVSRIHALQACAFNHSATPPHRGDARGAGTIAEATGLTRRRNRGRFSDDDGAGER